VNRAASDADTPGAETKQPARAVVPELDGVRGLAISGVMALHFMSLVAPANAFERAINKAASYGGWGVDLFFVLSGFLITGILLDDKGSEGYFRNFYARRTLRIFPLHYGILVLVLLVPDALVASFAPELTETRRLQGWLWTYLGNFYIAGQGSFSIPYLSHFWSLAVEEHFYLFWPFLVGALSRVTTMRVTVTLSLIALALRIGLRFSGMSQLAVDVLTPCRADSLLLGAFCALASRGEGGAAAFALRARRFLLPCAASIILVSAFHALSGGSHDEISLPLRTSLLAVFFGLAITCAADPVGPTWLKAPFRLGFLRTLGKYSYGLYVYHGIIDRVYAYRDVDGLLTAALGSHTLAFVIRAVSGIAISFVISIASYELYEKRFLKLKRRFESHTVPRQEIALAGKAAE
jgi:peptidoglycan/LPS O-acetylase OafA/YrhL